MNHWYLACMCAVGILGHVCTSRCTWSLNKDLPFKDPVFFHLTGRSRGRLVTPTADEGIQLAGNEQIQVFCPGSGNYIHQLGRDEAEATCINGIHVKVDGLDKTVKELECFKTVSGDVRQTDNTCAGTKGRVLNIGYASPSGWLQLFQVCYDYARSIPLYTHHSVYGSAIGGAFVGNDRPGFKVNGLQSNVSINASYKRKSQMQKFVKLVGKNKANYYLNQTSFLSRGHLAPDADFLLHSWQRSTYFYANAVPQWQSINGGNWASLERSIRNAAKTMKRVFNVWTGSSGTLQLSDENNNKVEMYLADKNRIPVPKYTWKVVCTAAKDCISFVVYNNPFERNDESVCKNICKETNWYQYGFENVFKGMVSCCEVGILNSTLKVLPTLTVKDVLNGT